MRILLFGEYSRLHNSLKEGLQALGHDVTILATGDGFKKYPVDIKISHSFSHPILKKFRVLIHKISGIDLGAIEKYLKAKKHLKHLGKFDVVQLINESSLKITPKYEIKIINQLLKQSEKLFLLSCGIDYVCMKAMLNKEFKYSLMNPYFEDPSKKKLYQFHLIYLSPPYEKLHNFIKKHCKGVIATDFDYHIPYLGKEKYLGLIPNPINIENIPYIPIQLDEKIKIFHGVNKMGMHKKGNNYFFDALDIIQNKYADKVDIKTVYNLPYKEYIKIYDSSHIVLDQALSYDQGYNALEAMAKGKVVFTGAEHEWLDYYNLKEDAVAINAVPNAEEIAKKLEWLILNPENIIEISKNARAFIEREHDYMNIAQQYLNIWTSKKV